MPKIMPCLWIDDRIEEMVNFYIETFKDGEIHETQHYPDGRSLTVTFRLRDQEFMALNGGPMFKFTEAISFTVDCEDQAEVDRCWDAIVAAGGTPQACGWIRDRWGLCWQVCPVEMFDMLASPDRAASRRASDAMMTMVKLDLPALRAAFEGRSG